MNKKTIKKQIKTETSKPRKLKLPKYTTFKLQKKIKVLKTTKLSSSLSIFKNTVTHLKKYWKPFLVLTLIYAIATIVLVRGFGGGANLNEIKSALSTSGSQIGNSLVLFGVLLGNSGTSTSELASGYQTLLIIVFSLAFIWTLRQTYSDQKIKAKDALYKGMYPVIPFLLVLLVISLQLIPLAIGTSIYSIVISNGLAVTVIEKFLWAIMLVLTILLSLYMVTSSIFSLYIITLPDMTPLRALRSARELVRFRRWTIMRKVILLPFILLLLLAIIMVPIIIVSTTLATWIFFILSMGSLAVIHSYMYSLYRELL